MLAGCAGRDLGAAEACCCVAYDGWEEGDPTPRLFEEWLRAIEPLERRRLLLLVTGRVAPAAPQRVGLGGDDGGAAAPVGADEGGKLGALGALGAGRSLDAGALLTVKFSPYSHTELADIILQRVAAAEAAAAVELAASDGNEAAEAAEAAAPGLHHLIERAAVTFCGKKVAASSGDARRALEVCPLSSTLRPLTLTHP